MTAIGIDLGTTNSLVSVFTDNAPVLIPNALGHVMTPSVVGYDDNGALLIGEAANQRLMTHANLTAACFKRYMGTERLTKIGRSHFRPEELSALVLKSLKADAEAHLGHSVSNVVISVPAYFNEIQRRATVSAGEIAGLKVTRLINEPTAAALAYGLDKRAGDNTFLVFDLGGGTFDISILEMFDGVMEVRASAGNAFLGGEDFTIAVARKFTSDIGKDWSSLSTDHKAIVRYAAECVKVKLGSEQVASTTIRLGKDTFELSISRAGFEEITKDLIAKLRQPIERSLYDTDLSIAQIDRIMLVGGATRMQVIRSLAARLFQKLPEQAIDPDQAVALGAAVQAGLSEKHAALDDVVMTDVCPFTLGIDVAVEIDKNHQPGHFLPIIERNTTVPASRVERIATIQHRQRQIHIEIYQGESPRVSDNIYLGELLVNVPPKPAEQENVDVRFTYDTSGLLEIDTTVVTTGKKNSLVIEKMTGMLSKEEIEKKLKALEKLKIHPRDEQQNQTLMARLKKVYEIALGDDRQYLSEIMVKVERVMERQDPVEVARIAEQVTDILDKIEDNYVS